MLLKEVKGSMLLDYYAAVTVQSCLYVFVVWFCITHDSRTSTQKCINIEGGS